MAIPVRREGSLLTIPAWLVLRTVRVYNAGALLGDDVAVA